MKIFRAVLIFLILARGVCLAAEPTFGDLAVVLAKGYFKDQVPPDARLEQCVAFLNRHGVAFSLFDLIDSRKKVSNEDVARVAGQSALLFSGEAEVVNGRIKKPLEAETWVDYCVLNDVNFTSIFEGLCKSVANEPLPEVRAFFRQCGVEKAGGL